jgi:uncharacterized membrane protein HdeD (DUF308 family)
MSEFFPTALSAPRLKEIAGRAWIWSVVRGVAAALFGIIAFVAPIATAFALALVIGLFAIVDGIVDIVDAVRYRGATGMRSRIVLGVIGIVFGLVVLIWPGLSLEILIVIIGIWAVIAGILQIIVSVGHRGVPGSGWVWGLVAGALTVVFGVLVLFRPGSGLITLIWILGVYAILFGIALILLGVQLRKYARREDLADPYEGGAVAG